MCLYSYWNDKIVENAEICISPDNRSFKYGDGCFETIKVINGEILLANLHCQRLFSSLQLLGFLKSSFFTPETLMGQIVNLVKVNNHSTLARVRVVVYAGEGGLKDVQSREINYIIQSFAGNGDTNELNLSGLRIGIYDEAKKNADHFSALKSNNFLAYVMGAIWSAENGLDDCLLTNSFDRIVETTIANVFIISNNIIKTPALTEGCVGGVMRRYLIDCFSQQSMQCIETKIHRHDLLDASEVFLTNAIYGLRWVESIHNKSYGNTTSSLLHKQFIQPLFAGTTF